MSADFSRWPSRPGRDYASVLLQQGRVLTDADWNEEVVLAERRERLESIDALGRAVVPTATPDAFAVLPAAGPDLTIGAGRAYLDGLIIECRGPAAAWDPVVAELAGSGVIRYSGQPWHPSPPAIPAAGTFVAYLKAWQRDRTAVEDPDLVEVALGVDTAARRQTVWQVKLVEAAAGTTCSTPLAALPAFLDEEPPAGGRLTTAHAVVPGIPDRCRTAPGGGYAGLENQLYRVEIHRGGGAGGAGGATFKWSRDNATVAARVTEINGARDEIVVDRIGRDEVLAFHAGDWIEITDDDHDLLGVPGELRRIVPGDGVDSEARTVRLRGALPAGMFPVDAQGRTLEARNTRIRRWDQAAKVYDADGTTLVDLDDANATGAIAVPGAARSVLLEEGIVVTFSLDAAGGRFRTGDHWVFAARTADASVELLDQAPPIGIHAHYAPLAVLEAAGGSPVDCRTIVPPLGGMDALEYVAGDGQEITPTFGSATPLLLPVEPTVGVARGPILVAGRRVRFTLLDPVGTIGGVASVAGAPAHVEVDTGLDGLASAGWALAPDQKVQRLRAELLDASGQAVGLPVIFSARLRTADEVAYDPTSCGGANGPKTVQDALDELCARDAGSGCCEVVRPGDDLAKVIERLAAEHDGVVCLCLLPGGHRISVDRIEKLRSLAIHGHAAEVALETSLTLVEIAEVDIRDIRISGGNADTEALLATDGCERVVIEGITAALRAGTDSATVLRFGRGALLRLQASTIENVSRDRSPGAAFVDRAALPQAVRDIVDLAERRPTTDEAAAGFRAVLDLPPDARAAAADEAVAIATANRAILGAREATSLMRVADVVRSGSALSPARFATLLDRAVRLGEAVPAGGRDLGTAVELLDGTIDATLQGCILRGAVVLYGPRPSASFEAKLLSMLGQLPWREPDRLARLPAGGGHLWIVENTLDRITVAASAAERLTGFVLAGAGAELRELPLFESVVVHANAMTLPTQALVGETVTLGANRFGGREGQSLGLVLAGATAITANTGPGSKSVLFAGAADRAASSNLRMTVVP